MIASKYQHDVVALTYLDGSDRIFYTLAIFLIASEVYLDIEFSIEIMRRTHMNRIPGMLQPQHYT